MRRNTLLTVILLAILAMGLNKPVLSTVVEDVIGGVTIVSSSIYASEKENITIDISTNNPNYPGYGDGLSPSTIYRFDDAITVENNVSKTGMRVLCVQFQSEDEGLKFYADAITPSYAIYVTLGENESKSVGIELNTTSNLGSNFANYSVYVYEGECS